MVSQYVPPSREGKTRDGGNRKTSESVTDRGGRQRRGMITEGNIKPGAHEAVRVDGAPDEG